jgi:hypothetical protein
MMRKIWDIGIADNNANGPFTRAQVAQHPTSTEHCDVRNNPHLIFIETTQAKLNASKEGWFTPGAPGKTG